MSPALEEPRDPELEQSLAHLERPVAPARFRAELRAGFLDLERAQELDPAAPDLAAPERRPFRWLVAVLAAAAAVLLIVRLVRAPEAPRWQVLEASGVVVIDGQEVPAEQATRIADLLRSAAEIEARGGRLRLALDGALLLQLEPGTRLTQVRFPAVGPYSLRAESGSLLTAGGPRFAPARLRIFTPELELSMTGTVFAVDLDGRGTCLCCLEGEVQAQPLAEPDPRPLPAGRMCFAWRDRRPSSWGGAYEPHLEPLRELETWVRENWKR